MKCLKQFRKDHIISNFRAEEYTWNNLDTKNAVLTDF